MCILYGTKKQCCFKEVCCEIHNKIYHSKHTEACTSVALRLFTLRCSRHHQPPAERSPFPQLPLCPSNTETPPPPPPPPPLASVFMNVIIAGTSYKWGHTLPVFLWLAYFPWPAISGFIHVTADVRTFFPLKAESHSSICVCIYLVIHQWTLGLRLLLAVKDAAASVGVQINTCVRPRLQFLRIRPGHWDFSRSCQTGFTAVTPFYVSSGNAKHFFSVFFSK